MTNLPNNLFEFARVYMIALNYIFPTLSPRDQRMIYATQIIALARSQQIYSFTETDGNSERTVTDIRGIIVCILKDERADDDYRYHYGLNTVNSFRDAYKMLEDFGDVRLTGYCVPDFSNWNSILKVPYLAYAQIKAENRQGSFNKPNEQEAHVWTQIKADPAFNFLNALREQNVIELWLFITCYAKKTIK